MTFLTLKDLDAYIRSDILTAVTQDDGAVLGAVELTVVEEMRSYLQNRYDTTIVFARTGRERNPLVVRYAVDLLLYEVHSRINPGQMPETREIRAETARNWLLKVSQGKLSPDLPQKINNETYEGNVTLMPTETKRNNRY